MSVPPPQNDCKTTVHAYDPCRWLKSCLGVSASAVAPLSWAGLPEAKTHGAETKLPPHPASTPVTKGLPQVCGQVSGDQQGLLVSPQPIAAV